jgi:membrane-bound serine protease (ClpP class)
VLAILLVLIPITLSLSFKVFPNTPFGRRLILAGPRESPAAGSSAEPALVGRTGTAVTPLRPSGVASIDGRRQPVVSEGDHIVAGETIQVVAVEGNRVVVRRPTAP